MSITEEINAISDRILELEQENARLKADNKGKSDTKVYDRLIDLLTEDIEWQEKHLVERTSQKMKDIVAAYREIRPKEGAKKK